MSWGRPTAVTPMRRAIRSIGHSPLAMMGVAWLVLLVVASLFASSLAPYGPLTQNLATIHAGPNLHHLLGTDSLGRDVLSRLMFGGSAMVIGAVTTTMVAIAIGLPAGLASGYLGGKVDAVVSWLADLSFALPSIVILVAVSVISPQNNALLILSLGVVASGSVTRLIRNSALSVREATFVDAARVAGLPTGTVVRRHIVPSTVGPLIVLSTQLMSVAVVVLTTLSYLGLGGSPETPSWGAMISDASQNITIDPWLLVPTGGVLILTVVALAFIGSTVRDAVVQVSPGRSARTRPTQVAVTDTTEHRPANSAGSSLLEVRDLVVTFPRADVDVPVVDGVSFTLHAGSTLGLVGESGCGKTVTALAIPGLLSGGGRVSAGSIRLGDTELTALPERALGRLRGTRIGFVSQEPSVALDPTFTVQSQMSEALRRHGERNRATARARVRSILTEVGIEETERVARSYPHQLSGGMAQRVAIALALIGQPDLLIADEPTTALDVTVQSGILDLLRDLVSARGMALLIVTHDLGVVADICDQVAVLYAGEVVERGPTEQVLGHPEHPYTMALLRSRPELGSTGTELATIEGTVPAPEDWPPGCRFADRCPFAVDACRSAPVALTGRATHGVRCIRSVEILAARQGVQA